MDGGAVSVAKPPTRPALRSDIQALRAVAVSVVVLNHLWADELTGGYIGVDIFFVISGFLITSHLRREVDASGHIKLAAFWARRAKRLLPAALAVLGFSAIAAAVWLPITNRQGAFDQIGAAGVYVLNWLLAALSLDYFAQGAALSPVTHYWSLSVEEQFYIVWPLLMVLAILATRKRSRRVRDVTLVSVIAMVLIISFAWAVYSVSMDPATAYFQTTGRAWEFAVGGLVAFLPALSQRIRTWSIPLVWAGWAAIAASAYLFDSASGFPGFNAAIPVAATALIIYLGDIRHPWAPHDLTSFRPVAVVGDLSYSIYLWHWPLIIAGPFLIGRDLTARDKLVLLAITIALAYLTKRFIEDPVRQSTWRYLGTPRWVLLGTAASMVLLLIVTTSASSAWNGRSLSAAQRLYELSLDPTDCFGAQAALSGSDCPTSHELADEDFLLVRQQNQIDPLVNGNFCMASRGDAEVVTCSFGAAEGTQKINVALIGDSHAGVWSTPLNTISEQNGLRITAYLASACAPTLDPAVQYPDTASSEGCLSWREAAIAAVTNDPDIDVVVTSSNDRSHAIVTANGERIMDDGDGYVQAWNQWIADGKQVVAINEVPQRSYIVPDCIATSFESVDPCTMSASAFEQPGPLAQAAAKMDSASFTFLDFQSVFCDETTCHSVVGGIPAYMDSDHMSAAFARSFAPELARVSSLR